MWNTLRSLLSMRFVEEAKQQPQLLVWSMQSFTHGQAACRWRAANSHFWECAQPPRAATTGKDPGQNFSPGTASEFYLRFMSKFCE